MAYKEVTSLRKSGKLDEAYSMAILDFQRQPDNWSAGALYWVLNDQSKILLDSKDYDTLNIKISEMENILHFINDPDGIAKKTLDGWHKKSNPEYQNINRAVELSRENKHKESIDLYKTIFEQKMLPESSHESYGWGIYKFLSHELERLDSHTSRSYLRDYLMLKTQRPSNLHSCILQVAIKLSDLHSDFKFIPFFRMWGTDAFTDDDWNSQKSGDKTFDPKVQKVIKKLFEAIKANQYKDAPEFIPLFKEGSERLPDSKFTKRSYAILLKESGQVEQAHQVYLSLIKDLNEWYVWQELAAFISDPEMRLSCLCKALSMQRKEDFIGNVRLEAAEAFLATGHKDEAARELYFYRTNHENKHWHISEKYNQLSKLVDQPERQPERPTNYRLFSSLCESLVYSDFPAYKLVLYNIYTKEDKTKCCLTDKTGQIHVVISQKKFPELSRAKLYEAFELRLEKETNNSESYYKPLTLRRIKLEEHPEMCYKSIGSVISYDESKKQHKCILKEGQFVYIPIDVAPKLRKDDLIEVNYIERINKSNKKQSIVIRTKTLPDQTCNFVKEVKGVLKITHKTDGNQRKSFGFIDNCYVPQHLIDPEIHIDGSTFKAKAAPKGEKWQVIELIHE